MNTNWLLVLTITSSACISHTDAATCTSKDWEKFFEATKKWTDANQDLTQRCESDLEKAGIIDEDADQEVKLAEREELSKRKNLLSKAINILNDREQEIISARKLSEIPKTLEELSKTYKISRERVRQIEEKAFAKLQLEMVSLAKESRLISA